MLATKEFKAFTDLESFEPTVASYCRLKFTKIREELSKYNVNKKKKVLLVLTHI